MARKATTKGLHVSVYTKLQTCISFYKSDTGSQIWAASKNITDSNDYLWRRLARKPPCRIEIQFFLFYSHTELY